MFYQQFSLGFENFDPDSEDSLAQELKLAALDAIEAEWRARHDAGGHGAGASSNVGGNSTGSAQAGYYPSYSSWMSYGTSFIGNIVENLQIEIRDVHVRYEDDISFPGKVFAAGFCLERLAAQTCDDTWTPR